MPEITKEWLEEQLALCAKATAGPWEADNDGCAQVWHPDMAVAFCDTNEPEDGGDFCRPAAHKTHHRCRLWYPTVSGVFVRGIYLH